MPPAITYRTNDGAKWGAGKGVNLTAAEVDTNFWELVEALAAVEALEPTQITSVTIDANQLTIHLEDASSYTVTIPVGSFRWRDAWQDGEDYEPLDLFTANDGLYLVLIAHSTDTDSVFNPDAGNMQGPFAVLIMSYPTHYDIGFMSPGKPGRGIEVDGTVYAFRADRAFYLSAGLPGSVGGLEHGSAIEMVFPIFKNGIQIGTFTIGGTSEESESEMPSESESSEVLSESETEPPDFLLGPQTGVFALAADVQFVPGDRLRVMRPDVLDADARDLTITFAATRGTL